MKTSSSLHPI
uniref:Uncharacterized protein n=1 Tax=Rhizophora mucronata TaxID=61149 RepID=A0A2P2P5E9_RHIMU